MYDFVADAEGVEMKNQMSAFSAIIKKIDRPFQGTIIRIPLRTEAQAIRSEICSRATTVSDVEEVVKSFCSEFGTSGLLFMKHVERIKIEIGNTLAFDIKVFNAEDVRRCVLKPIDPHIL
jgi:sacsin